MAKVIIIKISSVYDSYFDNSACPAFVIRWTFIKNNRAKRKDHELFF